MQLRDKCDYDYALKLYGYREKVKELLKNMVANKNFTSAKEAYRALKFELAKEKNEVSTERFDKEASSFLKQYATIIKETMAEGFEARVNSSNREELRSSVYDAMDKLNDYISQEELKELILAYENDNKKA